ncbi:MAG: glycosyltransferase family 39 protein [Bacteroidetes bacterium]|nr:glycosyltransferase family 39 protein [Bacteroidota bacterium]
MRHFFQKENTFFYLILFIASTLRLWNYWGWSYTHDELSAITRLNYDSVSQLISKGIQPDGHPAFVQLLLYFWIKLFGLSETSVRLPFVLAGIGSIALVYLISKKWFGFATACFSSLTLAMLDFPILYSQIARPYSFGLFFSLLAVWCWTNLLFGNEKKIYLKAIYYGIATALCMLTHYFAFFFAVTVALTGFLFLKKETWKPYLLSGIIAIMIFLPHIPVSLHQFGLGGVGEWLAKPESDYLWKFILYGFNESPLIVTFLAILFLLSILIYHLDLSLSKFHFLCIAWFSLPFLAGYYYSVKINPVLQYSTLLFSFPFLLIFLFSFFKERKRKTNNLLLASTGIILFYSTCIEQRFYKREYFGVFKEINKAVVDLQTKYGEENVTTLLNTSCKEIFDFYFQRMNKTVSYNYCVGDSYDFEAEMLCKIDSCSTPYFLYGWSNFRSAYEIPEMIKRKFPCIVYDEKHFNSQITLFGKNDSCKRDTIYFSREGFEKPAFTFSYNETKTDTSHFHSGKYSLFIESANEYCITIRSTAKNIFHDNKGCVNISAWVFPTDTFNAQIVMEVGDPKGNHDWQARSLSQFIKTTNKWQEVFATFKLPSNTYPEDEVVIYLWNQGKNSFYLDDFVISSFADSKYDYYETTYRQ